ncbi:hypothetical protein [Arsenophonus apicola]|uniref:Uncharacterized protein n=1 Tax=Arsenophonus apicola TaxID=2879119 RepID=A0ABY8P0Z7_9GAMM|nr:hypothetical protein [Arsenophonus apicola]WGO83161.1 hypothetical protein QG404_12570 [Arsenophonus apicola]WGO84509.1 hypothetical protein QG404_06425 [Arsenophonus apicola]
MKMQRMANHCEGHLCAQSEDFDIFNRRKAVISGNWSVINNGICTLTDLGLRHDGNGLVWLNSGISVHEADSDIGLIGQDKQSYDYHSELRTPNRLKNNDYYGFVQPKDIDSYALNIICKVSQQFTERKDGSPLATFALLINQKARKEAVDNWILYRNPKQGDKYTILNKHYHRGLIKIYRVKGWQAEPIRYIGNLIRNNAEFSKLMKRLGYTKVRTRKITGKLNDFWIYRCKERRVNDLRTKESIKNNKLIRFVQHTKQPMRAFKHILVDGEYRYVYEDHIHFLTKKRQRIAGKQLTGYTAKGVEMREVK